MYTEIFMVITLLITFASLNCFFPLRFCHAFIWCGLYHFWRWASLVAQMVKNLPAMQETLV